MAAYTKGSHTESHTLHFIHSPHTALICLHACADTHADTQGLKLAGGTAPAATKESNQRFITSWTKRICKTIVTQINNVCISVWSASGACFTSIHCFALTGLPPYLHLYCRIQFYICPDLLCFHLLVVFLLVNSSSWLWVSVLFSPPVSDPSPLDCLLTWASAERTSALTLKTPTWNASRWRSRRRSEYLSLRTFWRMLMLHNFPFVGAAQC